MAKTWLESGPSTVVAEPNDLRYESYIPGEWTFRGIPDGVSITSMQFDTEENNWQLLLSDGFHGGTGTQNDLSITFTDNYYLGNAEYQKHYTVIATRKSLPGHLIDRTINKVTLSSNSTFTLPPVVNGKIRDFLVYMNVSNYSAILNFVPDGNEEITFVTENGTFPEPNANGLWCYSFTEMTTGVFAVSLIKLIQVSGGSS